MQSCMNAFSNETNQPRFPDGRASESTGLRYLSNQELEVNFDGLMEVILFPGVNTCMAVRNATSKMLGNRTSVENSYDVKLQGVNNNVIGLCSTNGNQLEFTQSTNSYVAKWRGVSYGMFFQTVNNADENDGWWEAIRIQQSQDLEEYHYVFDNDLATQNPPVPQPLHIFHDFPDVGGDMVNQVSYSQGVIREFSGHLFQLNHEVGERDFVDMNKTMRIEIDGPPTSSGPGAAIPLDALKASPSPSRNYVGQKFSSSSTGSSNRIKDQSLQQFFDTGFDCIYMRIHGVDNSTGRSATRVTCTCAMNVELVYDEKALNSRFHQPAVYHPQHERIKGSVKAAEPNFMLASHGGRGTSYRRRI